MSKDELDYAGFVEQGTELVNAIMDRVPQSWRDGLAGEIEYGVQVPREFMNLLIKVLVEEQVPITAAERDTVVRLIKHRSMPLEPVTQFNLVAEER